MAVLEIEDWEDAYREKIAGAMPGVLLSDDDKFDESEAVYSVDGADDERFTLYRGQCARVKNQPKVKVKMLGSYTARELLGELSKLGIWMTDELADEIGFPSAEELFWESAVESLPGEYISSECVESGSGSWRSDWSVELDADGRWNLYAVYEPIDFSYDDLKVVPERRGSFNTREEAIAAIETESWDGDEDDKDDL